jgi:broad specificity phosphatase PhoE
VRVRRVLARWEAAAGDALVFGHGHALRALVAVALGFTVSDGARFALAMGAIGVIGHEREERTLRLWNVVPGETSTEA